MKSFLLAIAAVQIVHCSGVPSTKHALRASVIKLNEITAITNLCAKTGRRVTNTYRTGKHSYNVDLTFSVKETICSKKSGMEFNTPSCRFRPKKIGEKGFCKSRVEYFADKVVDIDVECEGLKTIDSESDSIESSENSFEVNTKSKETSLEDISNAESKSSETSMERPSKHRRLRGDVMKIYKTMRGKEKVDGDNFFSQLKESKTREHKFKENSVDSSAWH